MRRPRLIAVYCCAIALGSCGEAETRNQPAPAAAASPSPPPERKPVHDFAALGEQGERPMYKTTQGNVTARVDGDAAQLPALPYGQNAFVVIPDRKISRLTVTAEASNNGFPRLQIYVYGLSPDALGRPRSFKTRRDEDSIVEIRYWKDANHVYRTRPGDGQVAVDAFDGETISGSFAGMLAPDGVGAPVRVADGTFKVHLRVSGGERAQHPPSAPASR